jgi:hypothetical protein
MPGFRGSKPEEASRYKKAGHSNEDDFGLVFGGTKDGLPAQGKTDWIDPEGNRYSIKSGLDKKTRTWAKHWQIFLYGLPRLKSDEDFMKSPEGAMLRRMLESFPDDSTGYFADKLVAKALLNDIPKSIKGETRLNEFRKRLAQRSNHYFDSKNRLQRVTAELAALLSQKSARVSFFSKAFFNNDEVQFLAISEGDKFVVYSREDVVEILAEHLLPSVSSAGARPDDLNVQGQKVVFKLDGKNIAELEVRNEQSHYREIRFNGKVQKIASLIRSKTSPKEQVSGKEFRHILPH